MYIIPFKRTQILLLAIPSIKLHYGFKTTLYFRYTYGKPVQGQMEVKVCYNSPYGYGWRGRGSQFKRPCTERLLEVVILSSLA